MMSDTRVYMGWENDEDRHHRTLHIFKSHLKFLHWLAATDGLKDWNAGAHYPTRDSEVISHDANFVITHGE